MADLDADETAMHTYQTLFDAADDDGSNRISYDELIEAASASDEWEHKMCREEAVVMADAMFARARELYPERDIRDEDGLSFVEFVRATGASIKETTDNTDGLHGDVVEAQKARLSNTLRTVASKNTVQRRASVASYLREEVLAEMGPEENDDPEMAEQRSNILQHLDGSTNGSGGVGGGGGGGSGSGDQNGDGGSDISMEALSIIQSHANQLSKLEDLTLQKDQQIFDLQDDLQDKFSQINTLKRQRNDMARKADECHDRIEELEELLQGKNNEMISDVQREIEQLKETAKWALEKQKQHLEELKRQTREAEQHRMAAASEAAAISKRMAVQHVFARAASKSKKLEREIQHKEEALKKNQDADDKVRLEAELEARERELQENQAKLQSLQEDRARLTETQRVHATLAKEYVSVKKQLDEAQATRTREHEALLKMQSMHTQGAEELVRLKARVEEVEKAGKEKEVALLKKSAERQSQDMAGWKLRIEDAERRKVELQRDVERLQAEDAAKIATLQQEKAEQENRNRVLAEENTKREDALKVLQEQLEREHEECLRLKNEEHAHAHAQAETVGELHSALEALNKEHLAKKEEFDMSRTKERGMIEQLKRELAAAEKEKAALEVRDATLLKLTADLTRKSDQQWKQWEERSKEEKDEAKHEHCLCSGPGCVVQ